MQEAKCTVLVIQLFLTNCVKAHDNCLEVLLHINLYLSTRRPRTIGSHGHVNSQFFEIMYFQEFCHSRPEHFFQKNRPKIIKKNFAGPRPVPLPYGAGPLPLTKVGAKCLAAVMLDNQDRALRQEPLSSTQAHIDLPTHTHAPSPFLSHSLSLSFSHTQTQSGSLELIATCSTSTP